MNSNLIDKEKAKNNIIDRIHSNCVQLSPFKNVAISDIDCDNFSYRKGYSDALHDLYCDICEQPTVEAIPIEWINKYLLNYLYLDNERLPDDEVDDGYYYIKTMVDNWREEKENE